MVGEGVDHPQAHVGERADGQRNPLPHEPVQERLVLQAADAVVDPFHAEQVEGLPDVRGRALLAGVRHEVQPVRPGEFEHLGEKLGRVADLGGVESDPVDPEVAGQDLPEHGQRFGGRPVPQEGHDQLRADAPVRLRCVEGVAHPAEGGEQRDAPAGVGLRVEEDLRMAHPGRARPLEVGAGQVTEVDPLTQHVEVAVVQVQEGLQIVELVLRSQFGQGRPGQGDAVACGQVENKLGFEGALDVQVEFDQGDFHCPILASG